MSWFSSFVGRFSGDYRWPVLGDCRGYIDETYVKVKGKWCYLYRAIDRDGNLVDSMLSATRDMAAAQRFLRSALSVVNEVPKQVTTDGHDTCHQ
jgi:transposase-like protein